MNSLVDEDEKAQNVAENEIKVNEMLPAYSGIEQMQEGDTITPFFTKMSSILLVLMYIIENCMPHVATSDCLSPSLVAQGGIHRLFTYSFIHCPIYSNPFISFTHIILVIFWWTKIGGHLEKLIGTIPFGCTVFLFWLIVGPVELAMAYILESIVDDATSSCSLGFGGILFAVWMVETKLVPFNVATIYGIHVNKWIPPIVWIIIISVVYRASVLSHMAGVVLGLLYGNGYLGCFTCYRVFGWKAAWLEEAEFMDCFTVRADFRNSPDNLVIPHKLPCDSDSCVMITIERIRPYIDVHGKRKRHPIIGRRQPRSSDRSSRSKPCLSEGLLNNISDNGEIAQSSEFAEEITQPSEFTGPKLNKMEEELCGL